MKVIASGEQQITLHFGNQTLNGKPYYHTGIDVVRRTNKLDTIVAAQKGKVIKIVSNVKGKDLTKELYLWYDNLNWQEIINLLIENVDNQTIIDKKDYSLEINDIFNF